MDFPPVIGGVISLILLPPTPMLHNQLKTVPCNAHIEIILMVDSKDCFALFEAHLPARCVPLSDQASLQELPCNSC